MQDTWIYLFLGGILYQWYSLNYIIREICQIKEFWYSSSNDIQILQEILLNVFFTWLSLKANHTVIGKDFPLDVKHNFITLISFVLTWPDLTFFSPTRSLRGTYYLATNWFKPYAQGDVRAHHQGAPWGVFNASSHFRVMYHLFIE